jgi:hypothetical protein
MEEMCGTKDMRLAGEVYVTFHLHGLASREACPGKGAFKGAHSANGVD